MADLSIFFEKNDLRPLRVKTTVEEGNSCSGIKNVIKDGTLIEAVQNGK
jgi:hypothetical protein